MAAALIRILTQQTQPVYPLNRPVIIVTPIDAVASLGVDINGNTTVSFSDGTVGGLSTITQPYDIAIFAAGNPSMHQMSLLYREIIPRSVTFPANFTNSVGSSRIAPNTNINMLVNLNGSNIGNVRFNSGNPTAIFSSLSNNPIVCNPLDVLTIAAPTDNVIADISLTLVGSITYG